MAFLNSLVSAFYQIGISAPDGLWENLILNVFNWGFLSNYGWRVLVFTLVLKLLLSPIDIIQRVKTRKSSKVMAKIGPAVEKLEKQYANDQRMLMMKKNELMKQMGAGMNPIMSCLPMILTLVIFMTLFTGLRNIGAYKNAQQYADFYSEYMNVVQCVQNDDYATLAKDGNPDQDRIDAYKSNYVAGMSNYVASLEDADELKTAYASLDESEKQDYNELKGFYEDYWYNQITTGSKVDADKNASVTALASYVGSSSVNAMYDGVVESFLWIKNIWAPDVPWVSSANSYSSFITNVQYAGDGCSCACGCGGQHAYTDKYDFNDELGLSETEETSARENMIKEETYNLVMRDVLATKSDDANGYLVLPILSIALAFLTQFLTQRQQKKSGMSMDGQNAMTMKMMMWTMPILIGFFSLQYTASFSLYMVVGYIVSLITTLVLSLIFKAVDDKENSEELVHKYGRPNFNK